MKIQEAVAVFDDEKSLEDAVYDLERRGFDRAAFSLLGTEESVTRKLGHGYQNIREIEDEAHLPRETFFSRISRLEAEYLPAPIFASIGGLALAGVGAPLVVLAAAGTGALLGAALGAVLHEHSTTRIRQQVERGGLLLWVNVRNSEEEKIALEVLRSRSAHDVHVHELKD